MVVKVYFLCNISQIKETKFDELKNSDVGQMMVPRLLRCFGVVGSVLTSLEKQ